MSENNKKYYLVKISAYDGSTFSAIPLTDKEVKVLSTIVTGFNDCCFLGEHLNASALGYFNQPFDTMKDAKQYFYEHYKESDRGIQIPWIYYEGIE